MVPQFSRWFAFALGAAAGINTAVRNYDSNVDSGVSIGMIVGGVTGLTVGYVTWAVVRFTLRRVQGEQAARTSETADG